MSMRFGAKVLAFGMMVICANSASSQDYPNKPIRIVNNEAAGGTDFASRLIAPGISASLGQQVIVDNRPSGVILGQIVSKAPPDGYTLLVSTSTLWIEPFLQDVPWDPIRDFLPVTLAIRSPNVLVVHPALPVSSVKELIALARRKPGELNYASGGTGGAPHLSAELFKAMAGVNIVRIAYKGAGQALNDLIGGQVQLMFATAGSMAPHIKTGRLKALAVTTAQPSALAPGLPTIAQSGVPGYESTTVYAVLAPAGTARTIITTLNQSITRVSSDAQIKDKCFKLGIEVVASSPDQLAAAMKSEMTTLGKVIKDAGIRE